MLASQRKLMAQLQMLRIARGKPAPTPPPQGVQPQPDGLVNDDKPGEKSLSD